MSKTIFLILSALLVGYTTTPRYVVFFKLSSVNNKLWLYININGLK